MLNRRDSPLVKYFVPDFETPEQARSELRKHWGGWVMVGFNVFTAGAAAQIGYFEGVSGAVATTYFLGVATVSAILTAWMLSRASTGAAALLLAVLIMTMLLGLTSVRASPWIVIRILIGVSIYRALRATVALRRSNRIEAHLGRGHFGLSLRGRWGLFCSLLWVGLASLYVLLIDPEFELFNYDPVRAVGFVLLPPCLGAAFLWLHTKLFRRRAVETGSSLGVPISPFRPVSVLVVAALAAVLVGQQVRTRAGEHSASSGQDITLADVEAEAEADVRAADAMEQEEILGDSVLSDSVRRVLARRAYGPEYEEAVRLSHSLRVQRELGLAVDTADPLAPEQLRRRIEENERKRAAAARVPR